MELAHRFSLSLKLKRPLEPGEWALHTCDTPLCMNPKHLFSGNAKKNVADMIRKKRNSKGARHYAARLTESQVIQIRKLYRKGNPACSLYALGRRFKVCPVNIHYIVTGRTWK